MPAAVVKGILFSIGLIAALGIAVMESPHVQSWLEQQRRKIAELLHSLGEELDPQSRRAAEAFAFEGRAPANDENVRREAAASIEAAAIATGRSLSNASTIRRIPISSPTDPDEAEERRRKGREYLARRNEKLFEMQQRNKTAKANGESTPPTPTSFDAMVDEEGNLKASVVAEEEDLPSPPMIDPIAERVKHEMTQVERRLVQPLLAGESSSIGPRAWQSGSEMADPFSDDFALDRSMTPKPPVPPKVELDQSSASDPSVSDNYSLIDRAPTPEISIPGAFSPAPDVQQTVSAEVDTEGLSYEEQIAIALSLSEQESTSPTTVRNEHHDEDDHDLRAAIANSLKDMEPRRGSHAPASADYRAPLVVPTVHQPLVDLTPSTQPATSSPRRSDWESFFDPEFSPSREPLSMAPSEVSDELYSVTPQLTRARLATLDAQQPSHVAGSGLALPPGQPENLEASFYSAPSEVSRPPSIRTLGRETPEQLIDVGTEVVSPQVEASQGTNSTFDFSRESTATARDESRPRSEYSIEVVDVVDDSDVDMLSEEGIATPDSWSEIEEMDAEESDAEPVPQAAA